MTKSLFVISENWNQAKMFKSVELPVQKRRVFKQTLSKGTFIVAVIAVQWLPLCDLTIVPFKQVNSLFTFIFILSSFWILFNISLKCIYHGNMTEWKWKINRRASRCLQSSNIEVGVCVHSEPVIYINVMHISAVSLNSCVNEKNKKKHVIWNWNNKCLNAHTACKRRVCCFSKQNIYSWHCPPNATLDKPYYTWLSEYKLVLMDCNNCGVAVHCMAFHIVIAIEF